MALTAKQRRLVRRQLDERLAPLVPMAGQGAPPKGWIRAMQDALGMTVRQLARRLGLSSARVYQARKAEEDGSTTLHTMKRFAEAMGCRFFYAFVPFDSLDGIVRRQAEKIVRQRMSRVQQSMLLEGQGLSREERERAIAEAVDELLHTLPRDFWSEGGSA